jgi:hypothetical protein
LPGFHHDWRAPQATEPWPRMDYWPPLPAADLLDHHVVLDDGSRIQVPAASRTATPEELAQARAGDKGGNPNIGVWVPDPAHRDWLRAALMWSILPSCTDSQRGRTWVHDPQIPGRTGDLGVPGRHPLGGVVAEQLPTGVRGDEHPALPIR